MAMLTKTLINNFNLKIISFMAGICFWYFLSNLRTIEIEYSVPLTLYGTKVDMYNLDTDENITVRLRGYKNDLYGIDFNNLAFHINADTLQNGENHIILTEQDLFLPHTIKLVHYSPSNIVVKSKSI